MYYPLKDKNDIFRIGVAISDKPSGPFIPEKHPMLGSYSIDPCIFEDEGKHYMYFGGIWGGQLQRYRNNKALESALLPNENEPAIPSKVLSTTYEEMIAEGDILAQIHPNIVVKIPMIKDGIKALKYLILQRFRSLLTLPTRSSETIPWNRISATTSFLELTRTVLNLCSPFNILIMTGRFSEDLTMVMCFLCHKVWDAVISTNPARISSMLLKQHRRVSQCLTLTTIPI